jgi:hypothetical protein
MRYNEQSGYFEVSESEQSLHGLPELALFSTVHKHYDAIERHISTNQARMDVSEMLRTEGRPPSLDYATYLKLGKQVSMMSILQRSLKHDIDGATAACIDTMEQQFQPEQ